LSQNYPNPFNPETTIRYGLPEMSPVKIIVYSILGQNVKTLVDDMIPAGQHSVTWDGTDNKGEQVTSGMYIYRIEAGNFRQSRKFMLLR
jgi:flagellar hook assembly protein FlgD